VCSPEWLQKNILNVMPGSNPYPRVCTFCLHCAFSILC
jgi:hypothetical protein